MKMKLPESLIYDRAWDRAGRLRLLLDRRDDPAACRARGLSHDTVDLGLRMICESFDIPLEQVHCLRPDDRIFGLYSAVVAGRSHDEHEMLRLVCSMDQAIQRRIEPAELNALDTVADLLQFLQEGIDARRQSTGRATVEQAVEVVS